MCNNHCVKLVSENHTLRLTIFIQRCYEAYASPNKRINNQQMAMTLVTFCMKPASFWLSDVVIEPHK